MTTCKSPWKVMFLAWTVGQRVLKPYSHRFSRHDFTLSQLFACLVLREHQKKSFRGTEALLRDAPEWCTLLGMPRTPDHATLCRAFRRIVTHARCNKLLDWMITRARELKLLGKKDKPLAIDSSMYESRHVSRHFERRRSRAIKKTPVKPGLNRRRSRTARSLPKLALGVDAASHLILSFRASTGLGSDHRDFVPLLRDACRRAKPRRVAADAGYDSESNHRFAREQMKTRSIIPATIGRPWGQPQTRHRRNQWLRFKRKADQKTYGQRWQCETVNSMIKRNLGSALRARSATRRKGELMLRSLVHCLMVLATVFEG
jgi:hypothetical protein